MPITRLFVIIFAALIGGGLAIPSKLRWASHPYLKQETYPPAYGASGKEWKCGKTCLYNMDVDSLPTLYIGCYEEPVQSPVLCAIRSFVFECNLTAMIANECRC